MTISDSPVDFDAKSTQKPKTRVRRTKAQWKALLEEYATSGLTQAAFCQKHHIAPSGLCKWRKHFASQPAESNFIDITESLADKKVYQQWRESAEQVETIIAERSLPFWQKAHRVGGAYAGLALDGLKSKHRHRILSGFGKVNGVLSRYTLNSFDDYERIEDKDLREILRIVRSLTPPK
jgi:hypothetical protein